MPSLLLSMELTLTTLRNFWESFSLDVSSIIWTSILFKKEWMICFDLLRSMRELFSCFWKARNKTSRTCLNWFWYRFCTLFFTKSFNSTTNDWRISYLILMRSLASRKTPCSDLIASWSLSYLLSNLTSVGSLMKGSIFCIGFFWY